jgi:hypothetical protein
MRTTRRRTKLAAPAVAAFLLLALSLWRPAEASAQWVTDTNAQRPTPPPLHGGQHPRRELPAEGEAESGRERVCGGGCTHPHDRITYRAKMAARIQRLDGSESFAV